MKKNLFNAKTIKSGGKKRFETIQEHTDYLIYEYERLKEIYPDCNVDWELLETACLYHDLGKINRQFQDRIKNGTKSFDEIPHGVLSTLFLDTRALKEKFGEDDFRDKTMLLFSSIYYHHDRESLNSEKVQSSIEKRLKSDEDRLLEKELQEDVKDFFYDKLPEIKVGSFREDKISRFVDVKYSYLLPQFIMLKGLLNRLDYAASAHIPVEIKNDFLEEGLEGFMKYLKSKAIQVYDGTKESPKWNALQQYMKSNQDKNVIVIAQTGMGKTEAGLWWIGNNKGFFTLPIRTAINAIYERIKSNILPGDKVDKKLGLLHSETKGQYIKQQNEKRKNGEVSIDWGDYYTSTKQLSLPLTVCTLDQLFTFVFRYRGYEPKLATLSYSKIVIDEIQMYGPDIIGFLICGLKMIQELGGKFAILTATFPGFLRDLMKEQALEFEMPKKPFVEYGIIRHNIEWRREAINVDFILEKYKDNRILVICNTVKQCQNIYEKLYGALGLDEDKDSKKLILDRELNLFHGKFIRLDRNAKEEAILEFGKLYDKDDTLNKRKGIWITNSIAEASLDIDFDLLITELSDVSGLFQRLGRCYRKREWDGETYNCHVFDGGEKQCSGVGYNIDEDIFELSKRCLREYFANNSSCINEEEKMKLVENIYSTENMKKIKYYKTVVVCINQPAMYLAGEKSAIEAQQLFRNICSVTIIPSDIYEKNKEVIDSLINDIERADCSYEERIHKREELKMFTLDVEGYQVVGIKPIRIIYLGKFDEIFIMKAEYDSTVGLKKIIKENGDVINSYII